MNLSKNILYYGKDEPLAENIEIKAGPLNLTYEAGDLRYIKFNEIEKIEACIYSPIKDYGGWGIRFRYKAKAYNIKGNEGVKVYLKNGRHILFGSQCNKDFANEINRFMKL